ncbi:hypothetical protein TNCV_1544661 [Trichonephila clavipes]|nr:hypothetical protein TNCV_1544661 [Trichonephila clavipes]
MRGDKRCESDLPPWSLKGSARKWRRRCRTPLIDFLSTSNFDFVESTILKDQRIWTLDLLPYPLKTQPARSCGLNGLIRFCFWNSRISGLSDLSDDDNAANKTCESRIPKGESSSDESNEENYGDI